MSTASVTKLVFQCNNIGKESTLLLTFDSDMPGMYEDYFPVVWNMVDLTYRFALIKPQVQNGRIVDATTAVEINVSGSHLLCDSWYQCKQSHAGLPGALKAINDTGERQEIAVGTTNLGGLIPEPALFFPKFENASNITAQFTPKLRAYITPAYQEDDILRAAIHTPPIWERDLTALNQSTTWNITWDPSGRYAITEA
ncbi:hypothetical protein DFJ58DRAFT_804226 [Suillus subalutaceus]|uniref:uncharacterized protein n=1 Tax=Suillus subalutaceus TaxID=48586 RepID=UPI001B862DB6|nr:uncharacterized protein DFJ58DRAFT_804226 [Suillus subalutaceus]KAG1843587.1 hypothetical protein DFJ58DRAFT_804226 [Suillus subalutaceus]